MTLLIALVFGSALAVQAGEDTRRFNIKEQPLAQALMEFGAQSGLTVAAPTVLTTGKKAARLQGEMSTADALNKLLEGSGLTFAISDDGAVAVNSAQSRVPPIANADLAQAEGAQPVPPNDGESHLDSDLTSSVKLEEIVVTAQKRKESTHDIPMSISALSGDQLERAGVRNALDLSFAVPAMAVSEMGPGRQLISIRGISSIRGSSALIGTYLDEMPVSGITAGLSNAPDLRVLDMERVEVLKGPQGTLFGEGSAGGVIRFITKDPDLTRYGGEVGTEFYDTEDGAWSKAVTGVLNVPVAEGLFGLRIAAKYEDIAGWIDQRATEARSVFDLAAGQMVTLPASVARENINDSEVKHIRAKLLFAPGDKLRISAMGEVHRNDVGGSNVVNDGIEQSNFLQPVDRTAPTDFYDDYDLLNLLVTYDLGFAQLLSSTSYGKFEGIFGEPQLTRERPTPFLEILTNNDGGGSQIIRAQEIRLSATGDRIKWTVGASYKDVDSSGKTVRGADALIFGAAALLHFSQNTTSSAESTSWAGFGDVSYQFTDRMEAGVGFRHFEDERKSSGSETPGVVFEDRFSQPTYRGYLKYDLTPDTNVYATVGTGFRSGGFNNPTFIAAGAPVSFGPEDTLFYELGTKTSFLERRVRLDAALFYGEYTGMLEDVSTTINGGLVQYTSNSQDAEIKGFEVSLEWLLSDSFMLSVSGGVTDTEVTWIDPAAPTPTYRVGDPINLVPDYGMSVGARYQFHWATNIPGSFNLAYNRKGTNHAIHRSRFGEIILEDKQTSPEVDFLNATLGGEWSGWQWELFARNIFDERQLITPSTTGSAVQARPRTIGVGFSKSF